MKTAFKSIVVITGLLLIGLTLAAYFLGGSLTGLTRSSMEDVLERAFGSKVNVEGVSVSLSAQTIELRGVTVANPQEFEDGPAMRFERILVHLDPTTLFSDTPTVTKVTVDGAELNLKHELGRGINIRTLAEAAKAKRAASRAQAEPSPQPSAESRGQRRIRLEELVVQETRLNVSSSLLPQREVHLEIEPITIRDGIENEPMTPSQVAVMFMQALMNQAMSADTLLRPLRNYFDGGDETTESLPELEPAAPDGLSLEDSAPPE